MNFRNFLLSVLFILLTQTGSIQSPAQIPESATPQALQKLRADLDVIFSDPQLAQAQVCVEVMSLDKTEVLYDRNSRQLFTPASTNKLITAAVALLRLGPGHHFETRVFADGQVRNGTLEGNLIVVGSGDPSFAPRFHEGDPFAVFKDWAARLKEQKIQAISGLVLGDDAAFPAPALGFGWEWNDLPYGYATRTGALQFNDNTISVRISPGPEQSSPAVIRAVPLDDYLKINNRTNTCIGATEQEIRIEYPDPGEMIDILGDIPAKSAPIVQNVAVQHPTQLFLTALVRTLSKEGIRTNKWGIAKLSDYNEPQFSLLWKTDSPPLPDILQPLLKHSQNLYAETLVRALGMTLRGEGSFLKGKDVVEEALTEMEIPAGSYVYADGSGLSRQNLESADSMVRLLRYMQRQRDFQIFHDALPVAGVDGTLSDRMKKTRAKNNVHAKTGSMSNVSTIAGYVRTADAEMLAFSIAVNNSLAPRDMIESAEDKALSKLAEFSRDK